MKNLTNVIILIISLIACLTCLIYIVHNRKTTTKKQVESFIHLINNHNNKKRNNADYNKTFLKYNHNVNAHNNTVLLKFSKSKLVKKHYSPIKQNNNKNAHFLYFEHNIAIFYTYLNKFCSKSYKTVKQNNLLYRSINKTPIIQIIAEHFSTQVLVRKNFNVFNEFKKLTNNFKIYKKEALIFKDILIIELFNQFKKLQNNINLIKKDIETAKNTTKIKQNKKYSPAFIYSLYKFNNCSSKFFNANTKLDIISSTNQLLNELDFIYEKQRVIANYICYLNKKVTLHY